MSIIFFFGLRSSSIVMPPKSSDNSISLFSASTNFCTVCKVTLHFSAGHGHGQQGVGRVALEGSAIGLGGLP